MHPPTGTHLRTIQMLRVGFAALVLGTLLAACGGDTTERDVAQPTDARIEVENATESSATPAPAEPDAVVATGGSERPDWLPVWLFLPPDLEITLDLHDAGTGESVVTGWIGDGDLQQLYDDARFMTQSGGYIIAGEPGGSDIGSFSADHTSDGSTVRFGVTEQNDGIVLWSMEFSGI